MKNDVFQAIADPTRRMILTKLVNRAMTPNTLSEGFNISRQAVSKHIKILSLSQLLKEERIGREIYYHLNPDKMKEIDSWLEKFRIQWENRFKQLDSVLSNLNLKDDENQ